MTKKAASMSHAKSPGFNRNSRYMTKQNPTTIPSRHNGRHRNIAARENSTVAVTTLMAAGNARMAAWLTN